MSGNVVKVIGLNLHLIEFAIKMAGVLFATRETKQIKGFSYVKKSLSLEVVN